ncbi:MAG: hypothetical protein ABI330_12730 [Caldimonas sp.]
MQQRLDTAFNEAPAPQRDLASIEIDLNGNVLVLPALSGKQNHSGALLHTSLNAPALGRCAAPARPARPSACAWKMRPLDLRVQFDTVGNSHRSSLLERMSVQHDISFINSSALHSYGRRCQSRIGYQHFIDPSRACLALGSGICLAVPL